MQHHVPNKATRFVCLRLLVPALALALSGTGCGATSDADVTQDPAADSTDQAPEVGAAEQALSFSSTYYDSTNTGCVVQGVTMHCCLDGYAMIGANIDQNVFKCGQLPMLGSRLIQNTGLQRQGMHACPAGLVMVGYNSSRDILACQRQTQAVQSEYVDGNPATQDPVVSMHVCGSATGSQFAKTDKHEKQN